MCKHGDIARRQLYVFNYLARRPYCFSLNITMRQQDISKLHDFVDASKSKGATDEFLAELLTRRGWPAADVYAALGKHWEASTALAIPERAGAGESARDAFLYLLSFSTLAAWTTALGSMLFEFINRWFPDAVSRNSTWDPRSAVTWQMAAVVVAFPIYLLVMRTILREAANHPDSLESGVRKWLTYIALLGAAGAMICDLICFLDYFLAGGLTMRFVLKAATVMAISGAVFAYYITSLRWNRSANLKRAKARSVAFGAAATLIVAAAFSIGLGVAGTPSVQRRIEADRKRIEDLRNLGYAIKLHHDQDTSAAIPLKLTDLKGGLRTTDPETGAAYEYHPKSDGVYELCADFAVASSDKGSPLRYGYQSIFWEHNKGKGCFSLDASKTVPY
jgi:hypothetical protein